jgi:predicted nucleic acid-binding protein
MSKKKIFLDSSAVISGVISPVGAARALFLLSEAGSLDLVICEQVIVETERTLARKAPKALPDFRQALKQAGPKILADPGMDEVRACLYMISDPADAPILAAAIKANVDFLVTHNCRHFLDDPQVSERSGLRIGTPGDALLWLRSLQE